MKGAGRAGAGRGGAGRATQRDDVARLRYAHGVDVQAGVLAFLPDDRVPRFAVVTSRRTGRWVFPKGGVDPGFTPAEAAAQEALEEAGLVGLIEDPPVGIYRVPKIRPPLIWTVEVTLYPMAIAEVLDDWMEAGERRRRFVTIDEAARLIEERAMLKLAERLAARLKHAAR